MTDTKDAANNEMCCAIGRATTAWQHVEDGLCDLFNRIVICSIAGSMKSAPRAFFLTGNIFYSFTNLRARLVMMDNLIEGTITDVHNSRTAASIISGVVSVSVPACPSLSSIESPSV